MAARLLGYLLLATLACGAARAAPPSGLKPFVGDWAGTGILHTATGDREAVCRARFLAVGRLELKCEISGYVADLSADLTERRGALSGRWRDNASPDKGAFEGAVSPGVLKARISHQGVDADVEIGRAKDGEALAVKVVTDSPFVSGGDMVLLPTRADRRNGGGVQ